MTPDKSKHGLRNGVDPALEGINMPSNGDILAESIHAPSIIEERGPSLQELVHAARQTTIARATLAALELSLDT